MYLLSEMPHFEKEQKLSRIVVLRVIIISILVFSLMGLSINVIMTFLFMR